LSTTVQLSTDPVELNNVEGDSYTDQLPHAQKRVESSSQTLNGIIKDQNCDEPVKALDAKVKENVRNPSYSEIAIEVNIKFIVITIYVLESNLKSSDLLVARTLVRNGDSVPIRLLNPTVKAITLYSGANVATLSQAVEIFDKSEIPVSAVLHGDNNLKDVFHKLLDSTSLNDNHKQLLFTLLIDYSDIFAVSKD